jgi:membrane associated rhomboid family serine protease
MIPLRDLLPCRTTPWVTRAIVAVNVAVYLLAMRDPEGAMIALGAVAAHYTGLEPWIPPELSAVLAPIPPSPSPWLRAFTHMFVHGGLLHLAANMWFLWVFADNVEDRLGHLRFALLYLLSGFAALAAQVLSTPDSGLPMVGASGAVAGALGAYLVLFPNARVLTLVPFGLLPLLVTFSATFFLVAWLGLQMLGALLAAGAAGVAWWAHVGGFALGMALARPLAPKKRKRVQVRVGR